MTGHAEAVAQWARETPDRVAIVQMSPRREMTYRELWRRSGEYARAADALDAGRCARTRPRSDGRSIGWTARCA